MLQQISIAEAIERIEQGEEIKCLVPGSEETWQDYSPAILNKLLDGIIPLAEKNFEPISEKKPRIDIGKIFALKNAGWPVAEIAKEMGISEPTVRRFLKKEETNDD